MVAGFSRCAMATIAVIGAAQARAPEEGAAPRLLGSARQQALRGLQESPDCDIKAMQTQLDRIDDACCYLPDGNPLDCSTGPPVQCTATCAQTFLPFWAACRDASVYGQTDEEHFDAFNTECDATFHNDQGDNSIGNNVLDPTLCAVDKKHTFAWVEISPLQMDHCIGATPEEQAACGVAPPRTGITPTDVGTLIGFNDWTSGGRNTWAADDGWYDVQLDWGFTWYGREEHTITIGTNGVLSFGTPQYMYGGSEPVPCHGHSACSDGSATGIGMDGVLAVFWTDLDPGKVTDCPQTHHCGGGGNVYYKKDTDHLTIEYAAVQSWSWNNQYNLPDPGQTFEAVLWDGGDVLFQYLDMYCKHCSTAWSTVSIGYEDQSGLRGQQLEYGDIPDDGSSYFIPANCHSGSGGGGGH